ncbi:MAG: sortase [Bacilli bacterium]|nr:sortase [Bacilli bacterium]
MLIKRHIRNIGILCLCSAVGIVSYNYIQNKIFTNKQKTIIQKSQIKNQNYTEIPYLEIPALQISRVIKDSVDPSILDQRYVGIWNQNKNLKIDHHIVLAGHNVKDVFGKIKNLQKKDKIILHYKDVIYEYEVTNKKIISVQDLSYLEETKENKITLLTCTNDDQKRQIVIGKLIKKM